MWLYTESHEETLPHGGRHWCLQVLGKCRSESTSGNHIGSHITNHIENHIANPISNRSVKRYLADDL